MAEAVDVAGPSTTTLHDAWTSAVDAFVAGEPGRSVVLSGDGVRIASGDDDERPGASVLKLFLAVAVHRLGAEGAVDLDRSVALDELPGSAWPSFLDALEPRHRFTVAELAGLSLATGDNRVAGHLLALVGPERVRSVARDLECHDTTLPVGFRDEVLNEHGRANVTTAADCERVLTHISSEARLAALRPALRTTLFTGRLQLRLPGEVVVSHKTGTLRGVVNDVGIIHAPRGDFIACFLTDHQADPPSTAADIGACARAAYDAWEAS